MPPGAQRKHRPCLHSSLSGQGLGALGAWKKLRWFCLTPTLLLSISGMMCYPGTELWVPALYGMEIPDPEGSGLMVPILGMHRDGDSGATTPLAGTMEEAAGKGERQHGAPKAPGDRECGLVPGRESLAKLRRGGPDPLTQAKGGGHSNDSARTDPK